MIPVTFGFEMHVSHFRFVSGVESSSGKQAKPGRTLPFNAGTICPDLRKNEQALRMALMVKF
jgi:hypothetical protein